MLWAAVGALVLAVAMAPAQVGGAPMQAGYARAVINPDPGVRLYGFAARDLERPHSGIHDDIYVRACYLEQGDERLLILGFDLLFLGADEVRQIRTDLHETLGLTPRQILANTSHSHVGPRVGTWYWGGYTAPETAYVAKLRRAVGQAATAARQARRPVQIAAGATTSRVPLSRRRLDERGQAQFEPNPSGVVCDHLPIALLQGDDGRPVCALFSVSCHPSMISGWEVSAEYPGAACRALDEHFGAPVALFVQGTGGDAKPAIAGTTGKWRSCTFDEVAQTGRQVADEVIAALPRLRPVAPRLASAMEVLAWPLLPATDDYAAMAANERVPEYQRIWARQLADRRARGEVLPTTWPVTAAAAQLGDGLRLVGLEGEAVARWGRFIQSRYPQGVTFPLGYTNGQGAYLPTSDILHEGGYEVTSYAEYWLPSQLGPGFEDLLSAALQRFAAQGVR